MSKVGYTTIIELTQPIRRSTMVREVAGSNPGGGLVRSRGKIELA